MEINLTKKEVEIINDLVFNEFLKMNELKNDKFIDVGKVNLYIEKLENILDELRTEKD